ncbi:hypothetical protein CBOM_06715 [Ceraceosorus bombacis]|uniref:Uncharacterized protein n=1 Tax=Ceraceosorus bombacis TaxID=401625 RepID=A0A0P1BR41_9BASI|nr:hypothetical protein CBOM_06715 [Ceraceosorus bombacis]
MDGVFNKASEFLKNDKSGLGDAINNAGGGGAEGERREDYLDKGIDIVQERFLNEGKQDNETAIDQQKDNFIADQIRDRYKTATGSDFPIKDGMGAQDKQN